MPGEPAGPRFPLRVDAAVLEEDLAHATAGGRRAVAASIAALEREGVPFAWMKRCQAEHRDGSDLAGCVKIYVPPPDGPWGAVFLGDLVDGAPTLVLLAVGQRHPVQPWTPSVYQVAHRRLEG